MEPPRPYLGPLLSCWCVFGCLVGVCNKVSAQYVANFWVWILIMFQEEPSLIWIMILKKSTLIWIMTLKKPTLIWIVIFRKKATLIWIDIIIQDRVHSLFNHKITRSNPHRFKTWVCAFIFQAVLNFIYVKL